MLRQCSLLISCCAGDDGAPAVVPSGANTNETVNAAAKNRFIGLGFAAPAVRPAGGRARAERPKVGPKEREYYDAMPDPLDPEFTAQNPIVAAATRIRARRELGALIDASANASTTLPPEDAQESLELFAQNLATACKRLNAILGKNGVKFVRLEKPLRLRLRFNDERVTLDLDEVHQLVRITGQNLDGEYQFDLSAATPSLINLSQISTKAGYGEALTASSLLKHVAAEAELPPPPHLTGPGPLSF